MLILADRLKITLKQVLDMTEVEYNLWLGYLMLEKDEYDRDYRNIMNYGHTFGHAIEAVSKYAIPHGVAITMGMGLANFLSLKLNLLGEDEFHKMQALIQENTENYIFVLKDVKELYWSALKKDKKNVDEHVVCILSKGVGNVTKYKLDLTKQVKLHMLEYFDRYHNKRRIDED